MERIIEQLDIIVWAVASQELGVGYKFWAGLYL